MKARFFQKSAPLQNRSRRVLQTRKPRWRPYRIALEACSRRENHSGAPTESPSMCARNAKTSLGKAPNGFRGAPEPRKPRWAKLQTTFEALPKHENPAGQSSNLLPTCASTSLGIGPSVVRRAQESANLDYCLKGGFPEKYLVFRNLRNRFFALR